MYVSCNQDVYVSQKNCQGRLEKECFHLKTSESDPAQVAVPENS